MLHVRSCLLRPSFTSCGIIKLPRHARWATVRHGRKTGRPPSSKAHWSAEKLALDERYPLTAALHDKIHPTQQAKVLKSGKKSGASATYEAPGVFVRTQIVSPQLCDDVLQYIGPSLEMHRGCDILDINPGACLWSQKLHQHLKPRSHILLEPNFDTFKEFIDPLLHSPGSRYKLVEKDPKALDSYRDIIDQGIFSHQTRVDRSDPAAPVFNRTLLVTGSLAWDPRLPGLGFDSMAKQLFHHFASAAWNHDLFHAFGPVHTLFWVAHDDFNPMIAQATSAMQKANRHLEMTHELNLVVAAERKGRSQGKSSIAREPQIEIESLVRALKAGEAKGMTLPPHRRDFAYNIAKHVDATSGGTGITRSKVMQEYLHNLQLDGTVPLGLVTESAITSTRIEIELKQQYPDFKIDSFSDDPRARKGAKATDMHPSALEQINQFKKYRNAMMNVIRLRGKTEEAADIGEEMFILEQKTSSVPSGVEKDTLIRKIQELEKALEQKLASIDSAYRSAALLEMDDRLNLRHRPGSRIQWDMRPFEPMIMYEEEVWPRNRLALVSAKPKPKPVGSSVDWSEWVQDFIYGLYNDPGLPIATALDAMQHGLSDIIKDCPSLKEPKVGGRLHLKHLRVRMLTMEMIYELVQAYRDWPFKEPGSDHNKYFRHKPQRFSSVS